MPLNEPQELNATLNGPQRLGATLTVTELSASIGIAGPPGPPGPPGPSGAVFFWRADANATAANDPGAGRIRWNATPQADATALYVDWLTDGDFDVHTIFQLMEISTRFLIQDADLAVNYQVWEMTGSAINHPDWFEVPAAFVESSGPGAEFSHNQRVGVWIEAQTVPVIIQDEGLELPRQHTLNFVGTGVTASNDEAGGRITITIPGAAEGAVTSVFTRVGDVVANNGDYTAEQVTNAVSTDGAYPDPAWITSLSWAKITGEPSAFPAEPHAHAAADTTSGVFATARLASGTASAVTYVRGDGTWATLPATGSPGHAIQDESSAVTQRATLDFRGAGVTVTDDPPGERTVVTIPGGAAQTPWEQNIDGAGFNLTNVGVLNVGGTGVAYKLQVVGGRSMFYGNSEALAVYVAYNAATAGYYLGGTTNNDIAFTTQGGTERMRLTDLGQLGIRTSTPFSRISMGTSNQNSNSRIAFYESSTGTTARAVGIANPTGAVYGVAIWANTGGVVPSETNMHVFVQDGGNVGIGTSAPYNRLTVAAPSRTITDAAGGIATLSLSSESGAQTDDNLMFGVHYGDYSWMQASKPGTGNRILMLNPLGGAIIQSVAWQDTSLMPNGTMSIFYDEANNRIAFVVRGAGGAVKTGLVTVT